MQTWIMWVLAVYGLAVCWIQICAWIHRPSSKRTIHYYVMTHNSQAGIEWVIRSLSQWASLKGRDFRFIVMDSGSNDDTLKIVSRLAGNQCDIKQVQTERLLESRSTLRNEDEELKVVIDLR